VKQVPFTRPKDVRVAKEVEEDIWSLDAPWICFLSCRAGARKYTDPVQLRVMVGVTEDCEHDTLEVCAVVEKMLDEGDYKVDYDVDARRGRAR
jgi:hypothetical protein